MGDFIAKADDFKKQAEKKSKTVFGGMFGNKFEEAAELFEKAANNYKLGKSFGDAADTYEKLGDIYMKLDSKYEAATAYVEAAKCAAKSNNQRATSLLQKAVSLYTDMGRLNMAARQLREIGEQNEKQGLKDEAIQFYIQAADLFETENSNAEASKCKLKVAEFYADLGQFRKSAELFEEAAERAVESNLLKFSSRGYLLNAGICLLNVLGVEAMDKKMDRYRDIDLQFSGSREEKLLENLVDAFRNQDEAIFATSLAEFDSITRLDAWKTRILLAAKKRLQDMELGVGSHDDADEDSML
uniref:Uncharacterized protein n=1 Tax=Polytomella parva TaxID=51329 RepID=A0A7S0VHJ8_9CHLO|mmetsp:Transcript_4569/g.8284  ORF Transcript_4569/g.8284 Transcript_4569/m.8284 type:complete len:300 (+) Transcript_4569:224-1123(+)|eukprot:CAMPEP_0175064018 /NCGR_PEP_ID=MMETSP0052_2-20121109/15089_1 /TAXON_ID=51329 ORGANISM="Polytomella parva, Strain SAG 63-3" /NCGR_SAMPLE_ID=MMETSP0052_2 /ASSEMBLY_ACC=CAM_ASM_000194 /LENGTH=299 /DNA_ID=CAMNT_0016330301 /DNA_START=151 /DNA_END=1050 /DNA_ORIENTATION=+